MIDYGLILVTKYAGSEWTLDGDGYNGLTWLSDTPKPTQAELEALWPQVQQKMQQQQIDQANAKQTLLDRLGLTAEEARLLLS